jgi:predicted kinase
VEARSRDNRDASEAGHAVLERQIARFEPLAGAELADAQLIDTSAGRTVPDRAIRAIAGHLQPAHR